MRAGGLCWTYYAIVEEAYEKFLYEEKHRLKNPGDDENPNPYLKQDERLRIAGIKTIVFSAMCIEAASYDLAAIHLGDEFAESYLDRLDPIGKWWAVPKLICGESLDEKGAAMNCLKTLVRARNRLVHSKSTPFNPNSLETEKLFKHEETFKSEVHSAFKAIVLLSLELNEVFKTVAGVLPTFEKGFIGNTEWPSLIRPVINKCRQIHSKSLKNKSIQVKLHK